MIRVFYDSQIFLAQARGGISRYFVELIREFKNSPELGVIPMISLTSSNNLHASEAFGVRVRPGSGNKAKRGLDFFSQALVDRAKRDFDIRHFTFYSAAYGTFSGPSVSTLYDMIPELMGSNERNPHLQKRMFMEKSTGVASISQTSLRDMVSIYGYQPNISAITHLGVGEEFQLGLEALDSLPAKYLLFVGLRGGYKRGDLAIRALGALEDRDIQLVFVGPEPVSRSEADLIAGLNLTERVKFITPTADELPRVYANARALLFPNLYEGFGFPPIEAMRSGTPVVASENEINREISGKNIHYFPPDDLAALAATIHNLLSKPGQKNDGAKLRESTSKYTWHQCALETAKLYRRVLESA